MAKRLPKRSPTIRLGNTLAFARAVKNLLAERNWTQKNLADNANMSESMISRMLNNTNGRGDTFDRTDDMVQRISLAFGTGLEGYLRLKEIAFPEIVAAFRTRENVVELNIRLAENGKPLL